MSEFLYNRYRFSTANSARMDTVDQGRSQLSYASLFSRNIIFLIEGGVEENFNSEVIRATKRWARRWHLRCCAYIARTVILGSFFILAGWFPPIVYGRESTSEVTPVTTVANSYLWTALKDAAVHKAYMSAFEPYLGLSWVKRPALGDEESLVDHQTLGSLRVFRACKPHACDTERLVFVYQPSTRRGWGRLSIRTEILGTESTSAVERFFSRIEGQR